MKFSTVFALAAMAYAAPQLGQVGTALGSGLGTTLRPVVELTHDLEITKRDVMTPVTSEGKGLVNMVEGLVSDLHKRDVMTPVTAEGKGLVNMVEGLASDLHKRDVMVPATADGKGLVNMVEGLVSDLHKRDVMTPVTAEGKGLVNMVEQALEGASDHTKRQLAAVVEKGQNMVQALEMSVADKVQKRAQQFKA